MQKRLKSMLLITNLLLFNTSFAECNTDPNLRLIKFQPSNLAIYLTPESTVHQDNYDDGENGSIDYTVDYKGKPIHINNIFNHRVGYLGYDAASNQILPLPNISDTTKLIRRQNEKEISSLIIFEPEVIASPDQLWSTSVSFTSPNFDDPIGNEFAKSLFIYNEKCEVAEPDSIVVQKPSEIRIYFETSSALIQSQYYPELDSFGRLFSEHTNAIIDLQARADKTEVPTGVIDHETYLNTLSQLRAEAIKTYLIEETGVNPEKFTPILNHGISFPLSYSETEEDRKANRQVYIHLRRDVNQSY